MFLQESERKSFLAPSYLFTTPQRLSRFYSYILKRCHIYIYIYEKGMHGGNILPNLEKMLKLVTSHPLHSCLRTSSIKKKVTHILILYIYIYNNLSTNHTHIFKGT